MRSELQWHTTLKQHGSVSNKGIAELERALGEGNIIHSRVVRVIDVVKDHSFDSNRVGDPPPVVGCVENGNRIIR